MKREKWGGNMNTPYVFRKCTTCGEWKIANNYNFGKNKGGKFGLNSKCKACKKEYGKQYREENKDKIKEYYKEYYEENKEYYKEYREKNKEYYKEYYKENKEKLKEYRKQHYKENKEYNKKYSKEYREENKEKLKEYNKEYYKKYREKELERHKEYYKENKEYYKEYNKEYYKKYREKELERHKEYREKNRDKIREHYKNNKEYYKEYHKEYYKRPDAIIRRLNTHNKRREKKFRQGKGITKEQWLEMMKFFDWKCAYSGETLVTKTRTVDHIIPINKDGAHEIWNVVPMYNSYNCSKQDKSPLEWYKEQEYFSEERLTKIVEWQQYAYDKWATEEDDPLMLITDLKEMII